MTRRLPPADRKQQIMAAALIAAKRIGYTSVKRSDIAEEAEVTNSLVSRYWGTMPKLRRAIMRRAIKLEHLTIIAQGLVANDANALKAPQALKQQALQQLIS